MAVMQMELNALNTQLEYHEATKKLMRQVIIMREFIGQPSKNIDLQYVSFLEQIKVQPKFTEFSDEINEDIESLTVSDQEIEQAIQNLFEPV